MEAAFVLKAFVDLQLPKAWVLTDRVQGAQNSLRMRRPNQNSHTEPAHQMVKTSVDELGKTRSEEGGVDIYICISVSLSVSVFVCICLFLLGCGWNGKQKSPMRISNYKPA